MLGTSSHQNLSMKKYQTNLDSSDAREKTRAETSGFAYIVLLLSSSKNPVLLLLVMWTSTSVLRTALLGGLELK